MDQNSMPVTNDLMLLIGMAAVFMCIEENVNLEDTNENDKLEILVSHQVNDEKQQNTLSVKSFVKDKAIEMYAKKGLENLKKTLISSEPIVVGSIDKEKIKDSEMDIIFQLKNIKLYNLGTYRVKKFKSMSEQSSVVFSLDVPSVKATCNYEVSGTFRDKKINGKGDAHIIITNISIENAKIAIKETPQEIQIVSVDMCYNFKNLVIKQSGLDIEGLKSEEVTKFLNASGQKYLKENKKKICDRMTTELKNRANAKLKGKSRDQLSKIMKET